jgi:hypothetical protein
VAEKLRRSPVTHLFVYQELADALLFGEGQTSYQLFFNFLITHRGWGLVMTSSTSAAYLLSRWEMT